MPSNNEEIESELYELRALRNRARKQRANNELDQAKELYSKAIDVAKGLKSNEEVEQIEKIVKKIELDLLLQRLEKIDQHLNQINWAE
jgi:hypothetical protein